jgi:PAS domain-containing protein
VIVSGDQLRFAVEFATFLVALAGAAVVVLRPRLVSAPPRSRSLLGAGFVLVAVAAFLRGSLVSDDGEALVVVVRCIGIVLLALGTMGWVGDRSTRRALWVALVLLAAAEGAAVAGAGAIADWARGAGALGLGVVLITSARRSIPARFAVGAAATLLLVVLAVSVALSVVIGNTVEREAIRRIESRARVEADEIVSSAKRDAVNTAKLVALTIQGGNASALLALSQSPSASTAEVASVVTTLVTGELLPADGPLLYANEKRVVLVAVDPRVNPATPNRLAGVDPPVAESLIGSAAVTEVVGERPVSSSGSVEVVAGRALAVGTHEVRLPTTRQLVGVVVATARLDSGYLDVRTQSDPTVGLSLVDRNRMLDTVVAGLPQGAAVEVARAALREDRPASAEAGGLFLAAAPVEVEGTEVNVLAVVASVPTTVVDRTRTSLFRTLFLVALVTALVAFVLAVVVGERIGTGLRRLTTAAEGIQRGDLSLRSPVRTEDEIGVLSTTFDSMAGSIESLAGELRQTAAEEARVRGRLEAVVGGMGEALVAVDADGRIVTYNRAAEDLFSVAAAEAVGRSVREVVTLTGEDGTDLSGRLADPSAWSPATTGRRFPSRCPPAVSVAPTASWPAACTCCVTCAASARRSEPRASCCRTSVTSSAHRSCRSRATPSCSCDGRCRRRRCESRWRRSSTLPTGWRTSSSGSSTWPPRRPACSTCTASRSPSAPWWRRWSGGGGTVSTTGIRSPGVSAARSRTSSATATSSNAASTSWSTTR